MYCGACGKSLDELEICTCRLPREEIKEQRIQSSAASCEYCGRSLHEHEKCTCVSARDESKKRARLCGMIVSFGIAFIVLIGYIALMLVGGGYHHWVYALFTAGLLTGNAFRLSLYGKLKKRRIVNSCILFALSLVVITLSANSEEIANRIRDHIFTDAWSVTYYEYYNDNFVWHGPVYKRYTEGVFRSSVYTYDRQGNLISESSSAGPLM